MGDLRNQHKTLSNHLTGSFNRLVTSSLGKIVQIGTHTCMLTHIGSQRIKGQEPRICEIIIKKKDSRGWDFHCVIHLKDWCLYIYQHHSILVQNSYTVL